MNDSLAGRFQRTNDPSYFSDDEQMSHWKTRNENFQAGTREETMELHRSHRKSRKIYFYRISKAFVSAPTKLQFATAAARKRDTNKRSIALFFSVFLFHFY